MNISPKSTSRIKLRQRDKDPSGGLRNSLGSRPSLRSTQPAERAYPKNTDKSDVFIYLFIIIIFLFLLLMSRKKLYFLLGS